MQLFDAHVHLSDNEYSDYLDKIITSLRAMRIVACSVTVDSTTTIRSFQLFGRHRDVVKQFVGIHPEAAEKEDPEKFRDIFMANLTSIDGVGEIGLDGTYAEKGVASYGRQKEIFAAMLELAESTGRPVSIHSRRALDDVLAMLPSYELRNVLLHWFAGSKNQLGKAMDMGLYVSYGPVLVYSDEKKSLIRDTSRERILIETDGPVRYSKCFGNMPAASISFLVSVAASAAFALDMTYEETATLLERNTKSYLLLS